MNKNIMIVVGGAVVVAFMVALLVQVTMGKPDAVAPVQEEAKVEILVAAKDLVIGRELADGDMKWQKWPKSSVFSGAVVRVDKEAVVDALEGRLSRNVAKGEPVLRSVLLAESKGNFVAASLKAGMRAVAIKVSAESMVGGFIGPGDYVDIILTYKEIIRTEDDDPRVQSMIDLNIGKLATETILQNIMILAVDQTATRPDDEEIKVGKTVTLAASVVDAEKLALASKLGELTLSLRGVGDDVVEVIKRPTITDARLTSIADEVDVEYQKLKGEPGVAANIVRIYSGDQMLNLSVK